MYSNCLKTLVQKSPLLPLATFAVISPLGFDDKIRRPISVFAHTHTYTNVPVIKTETIREL